jgi:hypothetical protein
LRAQHSDVVALRSVVHEAGVARLGRVELAGAVLELVAAGVGRRINRSGCIV